MISFHLSGATFLNYHETFSKDDVRIPNKFFSRNFGGFLCISEEHFFCFQPIRCAYIDHVTYASHFQVLWKNALENFLSWHNNGKQFTQCFIVWVDQTTICFTYSLPVKLQCHANNIRHYVWCPNKMSTMNCKKFYYYTASFSKTRLVLSYIFS